MTDLLRVRMWAMGLAMEHTPDDADREATEIVAQWLVDWVMETGAAHEPELPTPPPYGQQFKPVESPPFDLTLDEADF